MLLFFITSNPLAQSTDWKETISLRGYTEARASHINSSGTQWQTVQRLRPTIKWSATESLSIRFTPQASLIQGRYPLGEVFNGLEAPLQSAGYSIDGLIKECDWDIERDREINEVSDVLSIERLYLDFSIPRIDFRLGRQAINWGTAQFFNPINILSTISLSTPWQERDGVLALKSNAMLGENSELSTIVAVDEEDREWSAAARGGGTTRGVDLYGTVGTTENLVLLGVDIRGGDKIGYWLEGAHRIPLEEDPSPTVQQLSFGIDGSISVPERTLFTAQLSYDSSGEKDPKYYDWASRIPEEIQFPFCEQTTFLIPDNSEEPRQTLGRWYALFTIHSSILDIWTVNFNSLFNLHDATGLLFPSTEFQIGPQWQLNLGAQFFVGEDGEFKPSQIGGITGSLPAELLPSRTLLAWARWSF